MPELEDIANLPGFGPSKIDSFKDAGYESIEDLQGITWEELGQVRGIKSSAKRRAVLNFLEENGLREKPEKEEKYEKFRDLLEELFQFESADLDFGVYRIMNEKRDRIEEFLDDDLQKTVEDELQEFQAAERGEAQQRLEDAIESIQEDFPNWVDENGNIDEDAIPDDTQGIMQQRKEEYLEAKKEAEQVELGEDIEAAIYQDLYRFFKRYYKDGDFIPQRRAANQEKYAIPYNGEEVKLHWANKDQYFVKTGEHFKDYHFRKNSYEIEFKLHDAHVEKSNKKGDDKYFILRNRDSIQQDGRELTVHFEYRPLREEDFDEYGLSETSRTKSRDIQEEIESRILNGASSQLEEILVQDSESEYSDSTVLQKHLKNYRTKNESDYFIHKDLGGFLNQELDFYLKNEVFSWKELTDENGEIPAEVRARLNAIENIATEIIDFITQIEDFQKRLYEKQKFTAKTEYCLTIDEVPADLYPEILDNEPQLKKWQENYALEDETIDESLLEERESLMIDTQFFSGEVKRELIPSSEPNNLALKSENAGALRLLEAKYAESIDCIYIDPPYNAEASQVPFKDAYEESSWLSMMDERIRLAYELLTDDGIMYVSIDDAEVAALKHVMEDVFGEDNFLAQLIWDLGTGTSAGHFTRSHEYILVYAKDKDSRDNFEYVGEEEIIRERAVKRISEKNPATEITFPSGVPYEGEDKVLTGEIGGSEKIRIKNGEMRFEDGELADEVTLEAGWAMKDQILSWLSGAETRDTKGQKIKRFVFREDGRLDYEKIRSKINPKTVIDDVGSTRRGTAELGHKFSEVPSIFPKPTDLVQKLIGWAIGGKSDPVVMDFFAGSGTAGEATLNLQDKGIDLNYILVEQGDHFDTLLKPRLVKSVYSREWNDLKPQEVSDRSHSFRYQVLEQYEDSLNNLGTKDDQTRMDEFTSDRLEYFLNFVVDGPSLLDLNGLKNPFNYEMEIRDGDEAKKQTIDLVDTFNYLLGLEVRKIGHHEFQNREYRVVKGEKGEEDIAVVWRPVEDDDDEQFFEDEREFLNSDVLEDEDVVYINYDSALPDSKSIEKTFQTRMWE